MSGIGVRDMKFPKNQQIIMLYKNNNFEIPSHPNQTGYYEGNKYYENVEKGTIMYCQ